MLIVNDGLWITSIILSAFGGTRIMPARHNLDGGGGTPHSPTSVGVVRGKKETIAAIQKFLKTYLVEL